MSAAECARKGHVEIRDVSVRFGSKGRTIEAVSGVSLDVKPGEFVSVIGPSGCGKSTLLNIVAGFLQPSERRGAARRRSRSAAPAPTAAWCSSSTRCSRG